VCVFSLVSSYAACLVLLERIYRLSAELKALSTHTHTHTCYCFGGGFVFVCVCEYACVCVCVCVSECG